MSPSDTEKKLAVIRQERLAHLREALAAEIAVARETKSDCEDVCQVAEQIDDAFLVNALRKEITGLKATNSMIEDQIKETGRSFTRQKQVESELRVLRNTLVQSKPSMDTLQPLTNVPYYLILWLGNKGIQDNEASDLQDYVSELTQATADFAKENFPVKGNRYYTFRHQLARSPILYPRQGHLLERPPAQTRVDCLPG